MLAQMEAGTFFLDGLVSQFVAFDDETKALADEMRSLSTFSEETIKHFEDLREAERKLQGERAFLDLLEQAAQMLADQAPEGSKAAIVAQQALKDLEEARFQLEVANMKAQIEMLLEMGVLTDDQAERIRQLIAAAEGLHRPGDGRPPAPGAGADPGNDPLSREDILGQLAQYVPSIAQMLQLEEVAAQFDGLADQLRQLGYTEEQIAAVRQEAADQMEMGLLDTISQYIDDADVAARLTQIKGQLEIANLRFQLAMLEAIGGVAQETLDWLAGLIDEIEAGFKDGTLIPGVGSRDTPPPAPIADHNAGNRDAEERLRLLASIEDLVAELRGDPSVMTPVESYQQLRGRFLDAVALAQTGDLEALQQAQDLARKLQGTGADFFGTSSGAYRDLVEFIASSLEGLLPGGGLDPEPLRVAKDQLSELRAIRVAVGGGAPVGGDGAFLPGGNRPSMRAAAQDKEIADLLRQLVAQGEDGQRAGKDRTKEVVDVLKNGVGAPLRELHRTIKNDWRGGQANPAKGR